MNPVQLGDTSKARSRVDRAAARTSAGHPEGQTTGVPWKGRGPPGDQGVGCRAARKWSAC